MAKILVVDDEMLICDLLRVGLSGHQHEVFIATNGEEALKVFRSEHPRITLLDIDMPEMNGIQVLRRIRAEDPLACIIMLTGAATDRLENESRQLGVTDFLKKGLSLDVLVGTLDREMVAPTKKSRSRPAASPTAPVGAAVSDTPNSILVVDDEPLIAGLLTQFLALRGYKLRTASNGEQALAMVSDEMPRMVILDMYMPGMNGLEVLEALRSRGYTGGVIALTASQDERMLQRTLEMGSIDVMAKPVDLERLALAIEVGLVMSSS